MKARHISYIVAAILMISGVLFGIHYAYEQGTRTGYDEGYSIGYDESEIETSQRIYSNQRDSIAALDLTFDEFISDAQIGRVFRSISVCQDCNDIERCRSVFENEMAGLLEQMVVTAGRKQGFSSHQLAMAKMKFMDIRTVLVHDSFDQFIQLNCAQKRTEVVFGKKAYGVPSKGHLVTSYSTVSNFATTLGTALCSHFMRSLYGCLCTAVMTDVVGPMEQRLWEIGAIQDMNTVRSEIVDHLRFDIAELCTVEDRLESAVTLQKKGMFTSTSDLQLTVQSTIKAGIDLSKHFIVDIDHQRKEVHIEVGRAEVLSHETKILDRRISDGWFTSDISPSDIDRASDYGLQLNKDKALRSDMLREAEMNSVEVLQLIISPMVSNPFNEYSLTVEVKDTEYFMD